MVTLPLLFRAVADVFHVIAGHARQNVASVTVPARLVESAANMQSLAKDMKCVCAGDPALPHEVTLPVPRLQWIRRFRRGFLVGGEIGIERGRGSREGR